MSELDCEYCGREVGNEGAKAQHEAACDENPENSRSQPDDQQREKLPEHNEQRQENPARVEDARSVRSAGETIAETAIGIMDDDLPTQTRTQAITQGAGMVGDFVNRWRTYREKRMEQKRQRATNVELTEATEYPECSCGYQFDADDIGMAREVRCPECQKLWETQDSESP